MFLTVWSAYRVSGSIQNLLSLSISKRIVGAYSFAKTSPHYFCSFWKHFLEKPIFEYR